MKNKLDISVKTKDDFALNQVNSILNTYFDKKLNDNGEEIFTLKLIKMEMKRDVIIPSDAVSNTPPKIESVSTTFNVPLITLSPYNFMAIESLTIKDDSEVSFRTGITINPKGYETIIEAFTQAISPVQIPYSDENK